MRGPRISSRYGKIAERVEWVRILSAKYPNATLVELGHRLRAHRPDLLPTGSTASIKQLMWRAQQMLNAQQAGEIEVIVPEAEDARRLFVHRMEEIWLAAMKVDDFTTARNCARDVAKACGADIDRPIRLAPMEPGTDLRNMDLETLVRFVSALTPEDRMNAEAAYPDLALGLPAEEPN